MIRLTELQLGGEPGPWLEAGFAVSVDSIRLGTVTLRFLGRDAPVGIAGWSFDDIGVADLDGLVTSEVPAGDIGKVAHSNGIVTIDHVVVASGDPAAMRQSFIRAGEVILELVGPTPPAPDSAAVRDASPDENGRFLHGEPARFWGLALTCADLERTAAFFGDACSTPRPAVQRGRRIATLDSRALGLGSRIALMSADDVCS